MSSEEVDDFLAHYGVLGMKWGVRKAESKARIERGNHTSPKNPSRVKQAANKAKTQVKKKVWAKQKEVQQAAAEKKVWAKQKETQRADIKKAPSSRAKKAPPQQKPKSGYRTLTEAGYLKKGFSAKEAEEKADRSLKIQKVVAITAGVTLATVATYMGGRKIGKEFVGAQLKKGTTLQHISKNPTLNLSDKHLYATFKKADKFNYQGTFATELGALSGKQTHAIRLAASKNIKAPSNYQGKRILSEVLGRPVSTSEYRNYIDNFHRMGPEHGHKFKSLASSKGFNAVIDTTDQNFFAKAYKPLIVFDSKEHLVEQGSRALSKNGVLAKNLAVKTSMVATSPSTALGAAASGTAVAVGGVSADRSINRYYDQNPGSKLSRAEVALALGLRAY